MNVPHSDALVLFGATGDLIYKKCFPTLDAMGTAGASLGACDRRRKTGLDDRAVLRARDPPKCQASVSI